MELRKGSEWHIKAFLDARSKGIPTSLFLRMRQNFHYYSLKSEEIKKEFNKAFKGVKKNRPVLTDYIEETHKEYYDKICNELSRVATKEGLTEDMKDFLKDMLYYNLGL